MTDEIKNEEKNECKCFCKSKEFKKFLITSLGTFVGVYCALSLFAALHRPPMMPHHAYTFPGMRYGCPCKMIKHHNHHFVKGVMPDRTRFQKSNLDKYSPVPFESQQPNTTK